VKILQVIPTLEPSVGGVAPAMLTLEQAADRLSTSRTLLKRLIEEKIVQATQVVSGAPWEIPAESLESPIVVAAIRKIAARRRIPRGEIPAEQGGLFSIT